MKANKYNYLRVIQFNCGYGWEDCCTYEKIIGRVLTWDDEPVEI